MTKSFVTEEEMVQWVNTQQQDRYSPYEIQFVCFEYLQVGYLRVD